MALSKEEWDTLIDGLAESNNGEGLDNFAVLKSEVNELLDNEEKFNGRISELETQNGALKKENFKLYARVGTPKTDEDKPPIEPPVVEDEDQVKIEDIVDENGRWV